MSPNLEQTLRDLEDDARAREEPSVLVDPTIEAFCEMRPRGTRGSTPPPPGAGRLSLAAIKQYLLENADPDEP